MRQDLVFKFDTSVDVYDAVPEFNEQTGETEIKFVFNRAEKVFAVQSLNQFYMTARTLVPRFSSIRNLQDRKGTSLTAYPQLFVLETVPQLDMTGAVMAWKHKLGPDLPRDYTKEIQRLLDAAIN